VAMMLRHSFALEQEAPCIENAVSSVLDEGYRTADLAGTKNSPASTSAMGQRVADTVRVSRSLPQ
jgi:3-isopropylmalate dehydrogenase